MAAARALAIVLTIGAGLPFAAHADPPDDVCDRPVRAAAESGWQQPGAPPGSPHCNLCHWLRVLSAFETVCAPRFSISLTSAPVAVPVQSAMGIVDLGGLPARAPPA